MGKIIRYCPKCKHQKLHYLYLDGSAICDSCHTQNLSTNRKKK